MSRRHAPWCHLSDLFCGWLIEARGSKLVGTVRTGLLKKRDRRIVRVEGELVLQEASLVGSQVVVGQF